MIQIKHYGRIDDKGKLHLNNQMEFLNQVKQHPDKNVYLTVSEDKPMRSNNQNRYYHGVVLQLLCDYTGYTTEEMHEILLDKFAEKKELKIKDETHLVSKRSHKMKTDEFEKFTEQIRIWAVSELGVVIPLPNEILTEEQ